MDRALTVSSSSRLFFSSTESCVPKMGYKKRGAISHPSVTSPRPGSDNCSADVTRTRGRAGRQASWSGTPLKPKKAGTKPLSPPQSLNKAVRGKARLCFLFSFLFFPLPLVLYFFSRFFPRYQPRFVPIPVGIARARPPATTTAAEGGVPRSAAALTGALLAVGFLPLVPFPPVLADPLPRTQHAPVAVVGLAVHAPRGGYLFFLGAQTVVGKPRLRQKPHVRLESSVPLHLFQVAI
mmetsp:Transcript_1875/g.7123  ORF Transcript_1875/g.7123 Transcript_1875/m.7123 type:complete len:237 (-) Transcript_1875:376-1086(-)